MIAHQRGLGNTRALQIGVDVTIVCHDGVHALGQFPRQLERVRALRGDRRIVHAHLADVPAFLVGGGGEGGIGPHDVRMARIHVEERIVRTAANGAQPVPGRSGMLLRLLEEELARQEVVVDLQRGERLLQGPRMRAKGSGANDGQGERARKGAEHRAKSIRTIKRA